MDLGLNGRTAVVTGGSSGIGLATVELLLAEGANVAFCGRDPAKVAAVADALAARFDRGRILGHACDVRDGAAVAGLRDAVHARFGAADVLVNNAGRSMMKRFGETTDAEWRDELDLKFFGLIHPTRAFLPLLQASDAAAIVCVNALLSVQPEPWLAATAAARAGALSLTKTLSLDLADKGIRVNSVLLGVIESGQWQRRYDSQAPAGVTKDDWLAGLARERRIPLGRFGTPAEVASAIVFLASPRASYITGAALDVSGGNARHV